jgi:hypothetical protein
MKDLKEEAMWCIDPLLGNDRETNEIPTIAKQLPARQWTGWKAAFSALSTLMDMHATMDIYMRSVPRGYMQEKFRA